jgi:hypothetical protein
MHGCTIDVVDMCSDETPPDNRPNEEVVGVYIRIDPPDMMNVGSQGSFFYILKYRVCYRHTLLKTRLRGQDSLQVPYIHNQQEVHFEHLCRTMIHVK